MELVCRGQQFCQCDVDHHPRDESKADAVHQRTEHILESNVRKKGTYMGGGGGGGGGEGGEGGGGMVTRCILCAYTCVHSMWACVCM